MLKYLLLVSLIAWAAAVDDDSHAQVQEERKKDSGDGHVDYLFKLSNGIEADESGDQNEVHGKYHYTTKEGESVDISYTADATGYHAYGGAIPTPPPTPAAILRALEYIKSDHKHNSDKKH